MEAPRYKTLKDGVINGALHFAGTEVKNFYGWPREGELEPLNIAASAIFNYFSRNRTQAFLPKSPWDAAAGRFYLPGMLHHIRGRRFPPAVSASEAPASAPRYRMLSYDGEEFAGKRIAYKEIFSFFGWPEFGMRAEPVNHAAKAVVKYYEANQGHPALPPSPFNQFDDALWLPQLPELAVPEERPRREFHSEPYPKELTPSAWSGKNPELPVATISPRAMAEIRREASRKPFSGAATGPRPR